MEPTHSAMHERQPNGNSSIGSPAQIESAEEPAMNSLKYWKYFALFMIMGSGGNWVFSTALVQEIPYFQNQLPEGLCIATYMNAATNFGFLAMLSYIAFIRYNGPISHIYSVPFILLLGAAGSFLVSGTYSVVSGGVPVMLLVTSAIGGTSGALSSVIMVPYLTFYLNNFISAARVGGSFGILLTALFSVAQDPGDDHPRFSPTVYFLIFGFLLSLSVASFFYILWTKIGLRNATVSPTEYLESRKSEASSDIELSSVYSRESASAGGASKYDGSSGNDLLNRLFPCSCLDTIPWFRPALPYLVTVGWIDFNAWGVLSAVVPFVMANVSAHGGSLSLAIAYECGSVGLVLGDFSTTLFRLPFKFAVPVYSAICFVLYLCAGGVITSRSESVPPVIILLWMTGRFLEAHMLTSSYRGVATEIPLEHRQAAARAVGISDQVFTTVGALISTAIVSSSVSC